MINTLTDKKTSNYYYYLLAGLFLFSISILDVVLYSFFKINLTNFLPDILGLFLPLIIGFVGLHLIRIEYSGIKSIDLINKNINTNNFNALLTLLIILDNVKETPPSFS